MNDSNTSRDCRGVPVGARSETALAAADDFNRRLVRLDAGIGAILAAQAAEPEDPLLALYAAVVHLYAQQQAAAERAGALLAQVADARDALGARDRMLLGALQSVQQGRYHAACDTLEDLTRAYPADLLSAKICEYAYYLLGQQHCGSRFRAHMQRLARLLPDDPDLLGMLAFAHELSDDFAAAEEAAHKALSVESRNPWAEHALSHALIRQGRAEEGRRRMRAFLPALRTCDPLIFSHDIWHLALLELDLGDVDAARSILEQDVWGPYPDATAQQVDAISLGWRLELSGLDLGDFWRPVADAASRQTGMVFIPFVSAHHAYALARDGRAEAVADLIDTARRRSAGSDAEARGVWGPVGLALVEAAAAHGRGDLARVAAALDPAAGDIAKVGGSDAQTDLFRMSYAQALARTGRPSDARAFWRRATAARPENAFDRTILAAA